MLDTKFEIGDVVCLKSETFEKIPIKMTIESIDGNYAYCVWVGFDDKKRPHIKYKSINCNTLHLISKRIPDSDISVGDCVVLQSAGTSTIVMNVESIHDYTCHCVHIDKYDNSIYSDNINVFALKKREFEISM